MQESFELYNARYQREGMSPDLAGQCARLIDRLRAAGFTYERICKGSGLDPAEFEELMQEID